MMVGNSAAWVSVVDTMRAGEGGSAFQDYGVFVFWERVGENLSGWFLLHLAPSSTFQSGQPVCNRFFTRLLSYC